MNRSNNDIMWDCLVDIFDDKATPETLFKINSFLNSYKLHNGEEIEFNFSHDNWFAVACWLHKFYPDSKKFIPTFGHHTKHPVKFIMFLWMKSNWFYPLRLLTMLEMIIGNTVFARRKKSGELHTSGILLDYYLCHTYDMTIMMKILTFIAKRMGYGSWYKIFNTYHGNPTDYNFKVLKAYVRSLVKQKEICGEDSPDCGA